MGQQQHLHGRRPQLVHAPGGKQRHLWEIHLFKSTDGGTTWTAQNSGNPLTSLQIHAGGAYGGPGIYPTQVGGLYQLWYHAVNASGDLPTDIYRATSPDLINWTPITPNPVLTHLGSGFEFDQVADPCVVEVAGTSYLFYDGDNNGTSTAAIGVATIGEPVANVITAVAGAPTRLGTGSVGQVPTVNASGGLSPTC